MHMKFGTLEIVLKDKFVICGIQFLSLTVVINWCNWAYRQIISIAYFHTLKRKHAKHVQKQEQSVLEGSPPGWIMQSRCMCICCCRRGGLQGTLIQMFLLRFQQRNKNSHGYLFRCFSSSQKSSLRARASRPCAAVPAATVGPFSLIDAHGITTQDLSTPPPLTHP